MSGGETQDIRNFIEFKENGHQLYRLLFPFHLRALCDCDFNFHAKKNLIRRGLGGGGGGLVIVSETHTHRGMAGGRRGKEGRIDNEKL